MPVLPNSLQQGERKVLKKNCGADTRGREHESQGTKLQCLLPCVSQDGTRCVAHFRTKMHRQAPWHVLQCISQCCWTLRQWRMSPLTHSFSQSLGWCILAFFPNGLSVFEALPAHRWRGAHQLCGGGYMSLTLSFIPGPVLHPREPL